MKSHERITHLSHTQSSFAPTRPQKPTYWLTFSIKWTPSEKGGKIYSQDTENNQRWTGSSSLETQGWVSDKSLFWYSSPLSCVSLVFLLSPFLWHGSPFHASFLQHLIRAYLVFFSSPGVPIVARMHCQADVPLVPRLVIFPRCLLQLSCPKCKKAERDLALNASGSTFGECLLGKQLLPARIVQGEDSIEGNLQCSWVTMTHSWLGQDPRVQRAEALHFALTFYNFKGRESLDQDMASSYLFASKMPEGCVWWYASHSTILVQADHFVVSWASHTFSKGNSCQELPLDWEELEMERGVIGTQPHAISNNQVSWTPTPIPTNTPREAEAEEGGL